MRQGTIENSDSCRLPVGGCQLGESVGALVEFIHANTRGQGEGVRGQKFIPEYLLRPAGEMPPRSPAGGRFQHFVRVPNPAQGCAASPDDPTSGEAYSPLTPVPSPLNHPGEQFEPVNRANPPSSSPRARRGPIDCLRLFWLRFHSPRAAGMRECVEGFLIVMFYGLLWLLIFANATQTTGAK